MNNFFVFPLLALVISGNWVNGEGRFLLPAFSLTYNAAGNAMDENDLLTSVLRQLGIEEEQIAKEFYTEAVLPDLGSRAVLVIPKYSNQDEGGHRAEEFDLDAYIVVVEKPSGKITHLFYEPEAWTSDAVVLRAIQLDLVSYPSGKDGASFSVLVDYQGSSRPNPFSQTMLSCFSLEEDSIRRVLKDFPWKSHSGEWDTVCAGEFEAIESTSAVATKEKRHDYPDIIVHQKVTVTQQHSANGECVVKEDVSHNTVRLTYDGEVYKKQGD